MMNPKKVSYVAILALCAAPSAWAQNLLTNGSFDPPDEPINGSIPIAYQSKAPLGWQNMASECAGFGSACSGAFITKAISDSPTPYGVQGDGAVVAVYNQALLSQTFTVGAGQGGQYALTWQDAIAATANSLYQPGLPVVNNAYRILVDGAAVRQQSASSSIFTTQGLVIDLTQGQHVLSIEGLFRPGTTTGGQFGQYTFLTNVNVVLLDNMTLSAVPEQGTWLLMGLGLGLMTWRVRTTRRA